MYWILIFAIVALPETSLADLRNPHLPWRSILDKDLEARGKQTVLCKLPPYPENGGYMVVDKPNAKPGDVFQNVSFVQYKSDDNNADILIQAYQCIAGEWSRSVFKYETEEIYFNSSWCPFLCPPSMDNEDAEASTLAPANVSNTVEAKPSGNKSCILPPYPPRGGYFMRDQPGIRIMPGDVYNNQLIRLIAYQLIEGTEIYKVNVLLCSNGLWYKEVLKFESNLLSFKKTTWCPLVCATPVVKEINVSTEKTATNNTSMGVKAMQSSSSCKLPPYPEEGSYVVVNSPEAKPGDFMDALHLKYSCYSDKNIVGSKNVYCINGVWSDKPPKCFRCGSITSEIGEKTTEEVALRKEMPWHASIYTKKYTPYEQICSGSIIATNFVVTAAHCFWNKEEVLQPASRYAVAAGKILRHWSEQRDAVAQKSDVAEIRISPKFRGSVNDFKDDIALLVLTTPLVFDAFVSPVCVDFDVEFDEQQLADGSFGKIASWSPKDEKDRTPSVLQVGWLPYVSRDKCIADTPSFFHSYITSDKICAGDKIGEYVLAVNGHYESLIDLYTIIVIEVSISEKNSSVHERINLQRSTFAFSDSLLIPSSKARMQRVPLMSSESAVGPFVLARSTTGRMALEV